ncbi:retention module-containing protein [Campylobacter concisus]|uniref:retention module-containing protein n=1 Tax=Campylobacter concisus TaxID=199 RepID=UPI000D369DF1|nr:retention module-containing protein [Campylobacter concisus]QPI05392.1 retention module-containing protein [Campylobacter concisus]
MAKEAGVVKSLTGKAVAVDQNGNARELKVGDIVYMGESVKTSDAADKVTIVANNGKEITILGDDTLALNQSTIGSDGLADISALQNAILNGGDLTKLEETAAGGNAAAAGGGDGVSLSDAQFAEGGHYSNINETYRNLTDTNRAFASYDNPVGGYRDGNDGDDTIIPGAPLVTFVNDTNNDGTLSRVEHGNDTDINTSKVLITVPNDGTVRAGDVLNVTVTDPDGNKTVTNVVITPAIISSGYPLDAPIKPGKVSTVDATITNFQGHVSGNSEDSVIPNISSVSVEFTEDRNDDGFLTYTENKNDGKQNESPVTITATDVIPGDILHITLTKPDGTVTPLPPITINATDIVNNTFTKIISDMPVAEGKISKVDAYVTDSTNSNIWKSDIATDNVTPDVRPTLVFTEDRDNDTGLSDLENGRDGNYRSTPVDITLPKDVVVGDKIVITYTDPLNYNNTNPSVPHEKTITLELTPEMVRDHKVTGVPLEIFPGVRTYASVHVVAADGTQKSAESDTDNVYPLDTGLAITLSEQKTLHEISRQESVTKINSNFDTRTVDLGDEKVNHTTAKITLPNRVDDGDKLTLSIKTPKLDPNDSTGRTVLMDPADPSGKTPLYENTTRDFTIRVNDKGVITKVVEHTNSGDVDYTPLKEELNLWSINVEGFNVRHEGDTTINASITHINPNRNAPIASVEASASLEYVKAPEVIFDEAHGAKAMTREQAVSDGDLNSTTVTIKLPKNAVSGDKLTVTINEPNETPKTKEYTVGRDANGKFFVKDSAGNEINTETDGRSFKISGIKTATGEETKVTAEIVDSDGSIQHAKGSSSVTIAGINDMAVRFVEDGDGNVSLTRSESKDGDNDLLKTTIAVKVPNNVIAGDVVNVTINNGTSTETKTYKVTGRDTNGNILIEDENHNPVSINSKNEIEIPNVKIIAGEPINVSAETTDASGGKKAEAQNHNTLEKLHDDMKITFDADDGDGILGNAEATGTTTMTTIKLPSNFVDGDKLIINSKTGNNSFPEEIYTIHKDSRGIVTVTKDDGSNTYLPVINDSEVKYSLTNLQNGEETIITAKVTDSTGADKVETNSDIILDTGAGTGTRFRLLIDEDGDRNGVLDREEAMKDGQLNTTSATLQIPTTVTANDTITVNVDGGTPKTYIVVSNDGTNVTIKDAATNAPVTLEADNKLKISGVHIDKDHPAKVEATINGVTKTAEAKLETFDATNLKVEFKEDDASRDGKIDRDEAVSVDGVKVTTISVQVPYNVIDGDKITVTINQPGDPTPRIESFKVVKDTSGNISLDHNGASYTFTNNTFEITGVKMLPGKETSATATITNAAGDMSATSPEAKAQLAPLSEAGLNISIAADANDNGIITRDESSSNTSKVKVSLPGSVIKGDKIDVEITNPDNSKITKHYEVDSKDVNGNITLKEAGSTTPIHVSANHPLELDAAIAVGQDTVAKVTLTDEFNNSVSKEDKAHAEIDVVRGIQFTEDTSRDNALQSYENSNDQDTTPIKVYLNEDARAGDTVKIEYTDPDNHTQTKTVNHVLTADDMSKGSFEQSLDINPISKYDLKVDATYKTHDGLETKLPAETLSILPKAVTAEYNEHTTMKGGDSDNDTLIVDGQTVDFSHVAGLDAKVESFENIQLKGNTEIKFNAKAIFDITDNLDTVLKIKGAVDEHGNSTTKVDLDHKWDPDSNYDAGGFKGYSSVDQVSGHTIHIQIDDKVQTDL